MYQGHVDFAWSYMQPYLPADAELCTVYQRSDPKDKKAVTFDMIICAQESCRVERVIVHSDQDPPSYTVTWDKQPPKNSTECEKKSDEATQGMGATMLMPDKVHSWLVYCIPNCPHCVQAKQWLQEHAETFVYVDAENAKEMADTLAPHTQNTRHFPLIFYHGQFIGGLEQMKSRFPQE